MSPTAFRCASGCGFALVLLVMGGSPVRAQGLVLSGLGPINRSMAGAATAAPLDAIGAIHWNPATINGLERSEMEFGVELIDTPTTLSSSIGLVSGSTEGDNGLFALPSFGVVYQPEGSCWSYGLGVFTIGGFGVNYPADSTNPILTPQPPKGVGVGPLFSRLWVLQIAPTAAYQLTDRISVGFAPTVTAAELMLDPAGFATPDDANGDGFPTYPAATHTRLNWGIGLQAGIYYTSGCGWNLGASLKSPQWFETFQWQAADELGMPQTLQFNFDYPMIVSLGAAYTGLERWLFAVDFRYFDFENTDGFRSAGFGPTGEITGLGWDSVFSVATGVQYQCNDALSLRLGYSYSQNPIGDAVSFFNVASPSITQNIIYTGLSYQVTQALKVSLAYVHAFKNSIEGPLVSPAGPLPGTSVESDLAVDAFGAGVSVQF